MVKFRVMNVSKANLSEMIEIWQSIIYAIKYTVISGVSIATLTIEIDPFQMCFTTAILSAFLELVIEFVSNFYN